MLQSAPVAGHPYPAAFPLAEIRRLVATFRGDLRGDIRQTVHDAYHVLGFVLGSLVGDPTPAPIGSLFDGCD